MVSLLAVLLLVLWLLLGVVDCCVDVGVGAADVLMVLVAVMWWCRCWLCCCWYCGCCWWWWTAVLMLVVVLLMC